MCAKRRSKRQKEGEPYYDEILEALPEAVIASMEVRDRWFATTQASDAGLEFFVSDLQAWQPGQTIRVAFLGGDAALHRDIAEATQQITDACNIAFDFGLDPQTGTYRQWSTNDTTYQAEIRVSFDMKGYFSLVGRDSINANIGDPAEPVGGRPYQRTLNLEGYHIQRPASWKRTTRHEFLHALAFNHEHQSPAGGCDAEFRWEDDLGYQPTKDANGVYIADTLGRQPGIYTYLAGKPNQWSKMKVNHNLRQHHATLGATAGTFDRESIMLYRFQPLFYKRTPSPCAPSGLGEDLSKGDKDGLQHLYPHTPRAQKEKTQRRRSALEALAFAEGVSDELRGDVVAQLETLGQ
jgi:hypothetical protein